MLRKLQIGCISLLFAGGVTAFLQSQWLPDGSEPGLVWDSEGGFAGPEYFDNDKLVFRLITAGTFAIPDEDSNYAVINAFQTWEDVENAEIAFSRGTNVTVDTPVESANEHFTIGFTDGAGNTQWGGNIGGATGLATTSFFLTTPKQISDADIAFQTSANFSNDGSTTIDLEATALHEVGHALGLAHSPHAQSEMSYVGSWIGTCQCNTAGRTLTEDDKLVMSLIYPVDGYLATVGTISGTIKKTSDTSDVHMAQIGLFDSNDVLITTSLSDSGTYKIEGVPPGTYTLRAFPTLNSAEDDNLHQSWESLSSLFLAKGAPTDFITTASDDAAGVVVSANTTTSQNLTVADGNSSMTCRFSTFKNGSTTLARTQGIRLKRGQAETVGLSGVNMPSVGTLDELSILGGGLEISNFKDEATVPSPAPDFGLLSETIVWDLSVDVDANFGSRALVLRNSAHPTERYLVFGYIEVYAEGSATAVAGTENPADSGLGIGQSNVIMNQFTISAGAEEDIRVREWEITNVGTGSSGNVTEVKLNYDDDGNGQVDLADTEIGTGTFAGPITFRSAYTIPAGTTHNFLISYSFNGSESNDDTYLARLSDLVVSGMDSSKTLTETGLPVNGGTMTIDAVAPTVDSVTADKTNGAYGPGEVIPIEVVFSEDVIVTGTPQITLETGGTDAVVDYTDGSPGSTLTFDYTVGASDVNTDLDYISTSALAFNSGTIRDSGGNTAVLTLAVPGAAGSLAAAKNLDIGLPVVDFTAAGQSTDETTVSVTVTATLDRTTSETVSVPFSIAGGSTAADPDDYTVATASPLTIAAGNTSATITINPNDDVLDEAAETVIVDMGTPVNASQGTTVTHTLTIDDDDATPTVTFSAASQEVSESAGGLTITAQLSAVSGRNVSVPFTVNVAATATVTNDYTITASPINIAAGQSSQDITVTVVDDGDTESDETVIVDMGAPTNADQGATTTHTVTITDNDSVGFTVTESSGTTVVAENSGTDTFEVVLDVEPGSDVVLAVTSLAEAEATVDKATLTFTIGNWDTGQTVTVTAVDDDFDRDDTTSVTLAVDDGSSDDAFDALADQDVAVTCTDDDTAGFTVTESSGSTVVAESAGTDTFDVVLDAQPESDVVLTVTSNSEVDAAVDKATLTFTTGNWDTGQTVTVTAVDDDFDRDDTTTVTLAVDDASSDDAFDAVADQNVAVTCTDDDTAGFTATESAGATVVAESAGTDTFDVVLDAQPESDVVLTVTSNSEVDAAVDKATLTFTTGNWDTGQTVTVTGVDDDFDRDDATTVALAVDDGSSDDAFDAVADQNVAVTCTDDDTAGFTVTESSGSTVVAESAGSDSFDVVLDAQPESDVVLTVTSGAEADATVDKATLTFTTGNWNASQTVTVTGVDDDFDRDDTTTVTLAVDDGSSNDTFDALADQNVAVTCTDDDTTGFTIAETSGSTAVGESSGTDTFDVVLDVQPDSDVVLTVTSNSEAEAIVDKATLIFTAGNWGTEQTVTVTGVDDDFDRDDATTVTVAVDDDNSDDAFDALVDQNVAVTCTDDDTAGLTISESSGSTEVAESAGTDSFDVVLEAQPESDVVLTVASNSEAEATVDKATLTFTTGNWDTGQTVTVTGVDDDFDRDDATTVSLAVDDGSSDDVFDAVADQNVAVTCTDDDTAGFTVSESSGSTVVAEGGGTDTFDVVLDAQPESDVALTVTSNSETDATVDKATLTFSTVNWDTGQTVTVTGVDDDFDRNDATTVTLAVDDDSSDNAFDAVADQGVSVACTDDDTAGFTITESDGTTAVAENGGTDTFEVVLDAQPESNVVFTVTSNSETDATVEEATLTFTTGNWDTPQMVTVTGVDDNFDRDDTTTVSLAVDDGSSEDTFDTLSDQDVAVTCTDDDTAGFTVTESAAATVVAENAGTDTLDVVLNAQPESDVVLTVVSNSAADATVDKASLTFTTVNWDTEQTVTVTGVDDDFDRDDTATVTVAVDDASSNDTFDALPDQNIAVTCTDDDTTGFTVTESSGSTAVAESGGTDTFAVVLDVQPDSDVVLTVTSLAVTEATVDKATLTFTAGNWDTGQTVTVTGVDDDFDRDDATTVTIAVDDGSSDDAFDALADQIVAVDCTDDDTAGFTISETSGSTIVAENAGTDSFDVVLDAQPESDVELTVTSLAEADATVDQALLTFTADNWDTGQTVTVTGVDDDFDRDDATTVTIAVDDGSSDDAFDGLADQSVAVSCTDDDTAGFTVTESSGSTIVAENAGTDSFDVVLDAQPESDVVLTVTSLAEADATVDQASLTFSTVNWDTPQTVTVTGVDDYFDRDDATTVTLAVDDDSSNDTFDGLADQDVAVTCTDDDTAGFTITEPSGSTVVSESGGTDTFDVALNAEPESDVTLTVTSLATAEAMVDVATLTFTTGDWDTGQTVTVVGVNDDFDRDDATTVRLAVDDGNSDDAFDAVADQDVAVTCTDDDTAGFTVTESSGSTVVAEGGGTDTFDVVLDAQPESDVVLTVTSLAEADATVDKATLTFTTGNWDTGQTVTVTGVDDDFDRDDATTVMLAVDDDSSNDTFDALADQNIAVTCTDDDTAGFTVTESSGSTVLAEGGGTDTFDVVLNAQPESDVVLTVASGAEADATVDQATLTFTTGNWDTGQTVTVTAVDDDFDRDDTTTVTLSVDAGSSDDAFDALADQNVAVTCTDDDTAGFTITESAGTTVVAENDGTDTFDVVLDAQPESDVVLAVSSSDTAEATVDFATLTFTTADWDSAQTVTVTGVDDFIDRDTDSAEIALDVDVGASNDAFDHLPTQTVGVTIQNDDIVFLSIADIAVPEAAGEVQFAVTLSMASAQTVSVAYGLLDGTARSGSDYLAAGPLTLEIPPGQLAGTIDVQIVADDIYEQDEQFVLELTSPVAAELGTATATATINDDELIPTLAIATATVGESDGSVAVTITLTGRAEAVVSVNLSTVPGTALAAEDYESHDSVVTWASTETGDKTVEIQIVADDIYEQDEQFVLELTSPVAAELGTATATATINDDELIPTLAVATATVGESDGSVAVTITLTGRAEAVVSVNLSTVPGTALAAEDYESYDSVVTWASTETGDKTVNVDIVNDPEPEDPESFDVQLSAPDNAGISNETAAVTINDDDAPPDNFMLTLNFSGPVANSSLTFGHNGAAEIGHDELDVLSAGDGAVIDNYLASGDDHFQRELHPQAAFGHWLIVVDVPLANETIMSWDFTGIALPGAIYLHEVIDTISIDAGIDMSTTNEITISSPQTFQISLGPVVSENVTVTAEWTMLGLPVISGLTMGEVFDVGVDGELAEPTWRWDPYEARFILVTADDPAVPEAGYFVFGGAERTIAVSGVEPDGIVQTLAGWQVLSPVRAVTAESLLAAGAQVIWELSRTTGAMEAVSPATELQPGVSYWIYCAESVEIDLRGD